MRAAASIIVGVCMPGVLLFQTAAALEANRGEFAYVSELAAEGFEPFGTSGVGKTVFGMKKGGEIFLCFLADTLDFAAERQATLQAFMQGTSTERDMPTLPVICTPAH